MLLEVLARGRCDMLMPGLQTMAECFLFSSFLCMLLMIMQMKQVALKHETIESASRWQLKTWFKMWNYQRWTAETHLEEAAKVGVLDTDQGTDREPDLVLGQGSGLGPDPESALVLGLELEWEFDLEK